MDRTVPRYYHVEVESSPARVGPMQRIVAAHLRYWGLAKLVPSATQGVGLLLEAAVSAVPAERVELETWWTGQHLITAVSHPDASEGGHLKGAHPHFQQIATLSDGWGSCTTNSRNIVWFSLRKSDNDREVLAAKQPEPWSSEALSVPRTPATHGSAAREPVSAEAAAGRAS
ncbi:pep a2 [Streptomyces sp. NPDC050264]|uniref:pep a2 n=1 Tax=Streptomyces sp. NPDC050264 TaxID=3155038 RepID=UPI00344445CD